MRSKPIIHPLLFALAPALFLYSRNIQEVPAGQIVAPLAALVVLAAVVWLVWGLILRNASLAAAAASLFLLLFFSYGHFYSLVKDLTIAGFRIGSHWFLFPWWMITYALGFLACFRARARPAPWTAFFTIVGGVLVAVPLISIGAKAMTLGRSEGTFGTPRPTALQPPGAESGSCLPNIYYIILDAYARRDILRELYGFDNSGFLDALTRRGFYIAERSRANYDLSLISLASSLNYQYLDETGFRTNKIRYPQTLVRENRVAGSLRKLGYKFVAFASGYDKTEIRDADIYVESGWSLDEFQNELLNTTPLPPLVSFIGQGKYRGNVQYHLHRKRILSTLEQIPKTARINGPLFVFAHIAAPHPPFVFGENGEPVQLTDYFLSGDAAGFLDRLGISREEYHRHYIRQLIFMNTKVMEMVDELLKNSPCPPIIILQADHGPRSEYVFCGLPESNLGEGLSILNAYYLPGGGRRALYPGITPVNSFRVVFNLYFGADLDLLPDKSYFTDWQNGYFIFRDVTSDLTPASP